MKNAEENIGNSVKESFGVEAESEGSSESRKKQEAEIETLVLQGVERVPEDEKVYMPIRPYYEIEKRIFDILFSSLVIIIFFLPALVLCLIIVLESPGPPIYTQPRVGKNGKSFTMYKFRSMEKDADKNFHKVAKLNEAQEPLFKLENDPRVTRVGSFIRRHSIDEIPQFLNVFKGDMGVVGPRPALPREMPKYTPRDCQRLMVKPGVTGYWQTRGRSDLSFTQMIDYDLLYIQERGIIVDIRCILQTIPLMFKDDGAK